MRTLEIDEAAASNSYRACLFLPEAGNKGVLAVSLSGVTPAHLIPRWLKRASHEDATRTEPADTAYGLSATGVVDLERLRQMLAADNNARIHLEKKTISGSGKRQTKKLVLEEYIRTDAERRNVLNYDSLCWASVTRLRGTVSPSWLSSLTKMSVTWGLMMATSSSKASPTAPSGSVPTIWIRCLCIRSAPAP